MESNDSNTVITRVKKLLNKSQQDISMNKSDTNIQNTKTTTSTVIEKNQSAQHSTIAPKIMDKIKANSQHSPNNTFHNTSSTSANTTTTSTTNEKSPKRDKILHTLLKERLLEKQQQQPRHPLDDDLHDLTTKLSKYANLIDDRTRSPSQSPDGNEHLPFSNSTNFIQNRNKLKPSTQAISIITNNKTNLIDYKPPISPSTPPRVPSPTQFTALISPVKISSNLSSSKTSVGSYGFEVNNKSSGLSLLPAQMNVGSKHKQSKSVDLNFNFNKLKMSLDKTDDDFNSTTATTTTTTNNLNSLTSTNIITREIKSQKNFIVKSAKFSVSEPNLSASIAKSDTSGNGNTNSNTKLDLVRQSLSFDDDDDDDVDKVDDSTNKEHLLYNSNKENEQNLINKAQRIFRIRNKFLNENNLFHKVIILVILVFGGFYNVPNSKNPKN
jgi:hypothetical protein